MEKMTEQNHRPIYGYFFMFKGVIMPQQYLCLCERMFKLARKGAFQEHKCKQYADNVHFLYNTLQNPVNVEILKVLVQRFALLQQLCFLFLLVLFRDNWIRINVQHISTVVFSLMYARNLRG